MKYFQFYVYIFAFLLIEKAIGQKRVLLKDVQSLTLYKGQYTTGRRSSPVYQLQCLGGSAGCAAIDLKVVQCQNKGFDGTDYQWECKADMLKRFQFGKITVSCEGYEYPDDPYVLAGSCGLEYEIDWASGHESDYGSKQSHHEKGHIYDKKSKDDSSSSSFFIIICFIGIVIAVVWFSKYRQPTPPASNPTQPPPYGFNAPPPPPYSDNFNQPPPPGFNTGASSSTPPPPSYGFKSASDQQQQQQQPGQSSQSSFGGFWTGAGLGGLAGYLFGSRAAGNNMGGAYDPTYNHGSSFFGGGGSRYRNGGGGGFFGGSGSGGWGASAPSSSSSETRTASGFGGTKRR